MTQSRRVIYESTWECVGEVNCRSTVRIADCFAIIDFRFAQREVVSYKGSQILIRLRIVFSRKYTISYSILFISCRTHNRYCGNKFRFIHTWALLYIIFFDRIQHMLANTYICSAKESIFSLDINKCAKYVSFIIFIVAASWSLLCFLRRIITVLN